MKDWVYLLGTLFRHAFSKYFVLGVSWTYQADTEAEEGDKHMLTMITVLNMAGDYNMVTFVYLSPQRICIVKQSTKETSRSFVVGIYHKDLSGCADLRP